MNEWMNEWKQQQHNQDYFALCFQTQKWSFKLDFNFDHLFSISLQNKQKKRKHLVCVLFSKVTRCHMTGVWLHVCSVLNLAYCCVLAPIHQKQKSCVSAPEGSGLLELGRSRYALHRIWWKLTHTLKWNLSAGGWVPVSSAALLWGRAWIEPVHLFQKISRPTVQRKMLLKKKKKKKKKKIISTRLH